MSRPSAMNATLTPVPSTMFCACGVAVSLNAVLVTCKASGSSNGCDGSLGQTGPFWTAGFDEPPVLGACVRIGGALIGRSGTIAATDGSAASALDCAVVTVAEIALTVENPCRFLAPSVFARSSSGDWSVLKAFMRADE